MPVICPASLKINWAREAARWLTRKLSVAVANGLDLPVTDVVIVNYDILKKHHTALITRQFDLAILDESHYIKNPKAQRTKLTTEIAAKARRRLLLTGTPLVNRPVELWPLLQLLDPTRWTSFFSYAKRYCSAHQVPIGRGRMAWDFTGASHLDELQTILRQTVMVRRLKKDVLTELPPKVRQVIELAPNGAEDFLQRERETEARHREVIEELETARDFAEANENQAEYERAVAALQEAYRVQFTELARVRHETAVAKAPRVAEHIRDLLDGSLDARLAKTLVAKQRVLDATLDKQAPTPSPQASLPEAHKPKVPTVTLTSAQVEAVHTMLRILAGVCDGAFFLDGCGFNKLDTDFGKSLAAQPTLTDRQAAFGWRMVRKYRRQLPVELYQVAYGAGEVENGGMVLA